MRGEADEPEELVEKDNETEQLPRLLSETSQRTGR